jgi:PAS domain S-box-containing protein
MKETLSRRTIWIIAIVASVLVAGPLLWMTLRPHRLEDRVYRIGWESDPPFQAIGPDGKPTGLAIELVREAARRRGLRLEWLLQTGGSEASLRSKKVDLWPLITITPERKNVIHITDPYLESEQCILVLGSSPHLRLQDLAGATISYYDLPMNERHLRNYLPDAQLVPRSTLKASIEDVCQHIAEGVFLEEYTAISALLSGPVCSNQSLRMIPIPGSRPRLGIGATFEARAAADALRDEIGAMAVEGRLYEVLSHWSYFSNKNLESLDALLDAKRRERFLAAAALIFASLFGLTLWQAVRIHRERNRTRLAEQALGQREEIFRAIVETTKEWIWAIDLEGRHTYSNPALETILGFSAAEWIGKPSLDYIHPEDRPKVKVLLEEKTAAKDGWSGLILRWRHKDGSYRYLESSATPILDGQGKLVGFQGADRDITERIKADELRAGLELQLRQAQKMEAFGQLAGGIAHDFNNLLTVSNGYCDFLLARMKEEDPFYEYVLEIRQSGERAASLTRQLLTFSRRQVVQLKDLDLNEVVGNMTKMFQRLIGEDIALEAQFAPGSALLRADPGMIEQVLMNLAVNARDAMPKGGRLTIKTAIVAIDARAAQIDPRMRPGRYVRLTVSDTGCGITPEHLPHIFEPFFTTKETGKGTGLGLATVFGIVEQHHGWIDVKSRLGDGTTFNIYLPHLTGTAAAASRAIPAPGAPGGTETILLVEDEAQVRALARRYLQRCGYQVLEAGSGPAALKLWEQSHQEVDLLLIDMVMPGGITGLELAEQLRAGKPSLKILYSTGYSEEALGQDFFSRTDISLLRKPYTLSELGHAVRGTLDVGQS